jgi:hypothetical protein
LARFLGAATSFGVYQLLENKKFPQLFDWVVFDESSQMLAPMINDYYISSEQIGIISPHRLQNNTIISALKESYLFH